MKLRWAAILVPGIAIGVLDLWTDHDWNEVISSPLNTLVVPVLLLSGAVAFASAAFRRVDRLASEVRVRDAELAGVAAVQGERERIAREMHDGLAQVLGYVNTKAQAVEELLAAGRTGDARRQLAELSSAARSVYVDVREAILGLSSPVPEGQGLVTALESFTSRFADASKLAVSLEAGPDVRALHLPRDAEAQIFRIAQEALTNVQKHASAHRVRVSLMVDDRELVMTVADDGIGLARAETATDWPHYGMQSMRDRAASIGGNIDWRSLTDGGTTLRLSLPTDRVAATA